MYNVEWETSKRVIERDSLKNTSHIGLLAVVGSGLKRKHICKYLKYYKMYNKLSSILKTSTIFIQNKEIPH